MALALGACADPQPDAAVVADDTTAAATDTAAAAAEEEEEEEEEEADQETATAPVDADTAEQTGNRSTSPPKPVDYDWGQMTVIATGDVFLDSRSEGVLRIGDSCVVAERSDSTILIAWYDTVASWDGEAQAVVIHHTDAVDVVTYLHDGDLVEFGGHTIWSTVSDGGEANPPLGLDGSLWVRAPEPDCQFDEVFAAHSADLFVPEPEQSAAPSGEGQPYAVIDTEEFARPESTITGTLQARSGCLVVEQVDGTTNGLAWSAGQAAVYESELELPGETAAIIEFGTEVEVVGQFVLTSDIDGWINEPGEYCDHDPLWVAQFTAGGRRE